MAAVHCGQVFIHAVHPFVVEAPGACFAEAQGREVGRRIGVGKGEILVLAAEISLLAGKGDDIAGSDDVVLVLEVELVDAALVGVGRDAVVGDADGHPHSPFAARAFANHFHNPDFVGVGNGETLALAGITVFLHQRRHHLNGFAGSAAALQAQRHQADVVDTLVFAIQFGAAAKGGFGDGHLVLVDLANHGIGDGGFRDFA